MTRLTQASVFVYNTRAEVQHFKRLALLFDEIYCVIPADSVLSPKVLKDSTRIKHRPDGTTVILGFNFFRDTHRGISHTEDFLTGELRDLLFAFRDAGILQFKSEADLRPSESRELFTDIENILVSCDASDPEFNRLSGTSPEEYLNEKLIMQALRVEMEDGTSETIYTIDEPEAITDSHQLSTNLLCAQLNGTMPVFTGEHHRRQLEYRYDQYKAGLALLAELYPGTVAESEFRANFAEVTCFVGSRVFTDQTLASMSPGDILRYRDALGGARQRFVSGELLELTDLVTQNAWSAATKVEVGKFVDGKLKQSVEEFENRSKNAAEKLFGSLAVHAAEAVKSATLTATAGGVVGAVAPFASPWTMVALCALAGASKEAPKLMKDLVDYILELRKVERSSVAYVANWLRKT